LKELKWLDLKNNPLVSTLAEAAGDCLDQKGCQEAAKKVVKLMTVVHAELEKKRLKELEEIKCKYFSYLGYLAILHKLGQDLTFKVINNNFMCIQQRSKWPRSRKRIERRSERDRKRRRKKINEKPKQLLNTKPP
jgi:hypothetical protein